MAIGLSGIGSGWDEPEPNGGGAGGGGSTVVVGAAKSDEELALDLEKSAEKLRSDLISQMCSVSNIDSPIFVPATCASGLVTARRLSSQRADCVSCPHILPTYSVRATRALRRWHGRQSALLQVAQDDCNIRVSCIAAQGPGAGGVVQGPPPLRPFPTAAAAAAAATRAHTYSVGAPVMVVRRRGGCGKCCPLACRVHYSQVLKTQTEEDNEAWRSANNKCALPCAERPASTIYPLTQAGRVLNYHCHRQASPTHLWHDICGTTSHAPALVAGKSCSSCTPNQHRVCLQLSVCMQCMHAPVGLSAWATLLAQV